MYHSVVTLVHERSEGGIGILQNTRPLSMAGLGPGKGRSRPSLGYAAFGHPVQQAKPRKPRPLRHALWPSSEHASLKLRWTRAWSLPRRGQIYHAQGAAGTLPGGSYPFEKRRGSRSDRHSRSRHCPLSGRMATEGHFGHRQKGSCTPWPCIRSGAQGMGYPRPQPCTRHQTAAEWQA